MNIPFHNRYITLDDRFYVKTSPTPVSQPALIRFNETLANSLGFSAADWEDNDVAAVFAGNTVPQGAEPIAMAYAGHQFGNFVPQLGDGRAILLGEVNGIDGVLYGLQLKGSGPTYFSRNGDGRAALGPVLREYLLSEAMACLNVPTTRALCAVTTGDGVAREQFLPGGVITRVASSFVRVGTFEYFRSRGDVEAIKGLADYVIEHNYPGLAATENPYLSMLQAVVERQAALIARWMHLGFIHGVMNTDNMSVAGETIDYGPCAFMDDYRHDKVFSSIDRHGRYAYHNQPAIGLWNLSRFAECLVPLLANDTNVAIELAQQVLTGFIEQYESQWLSGMRAKCGLTEQKELASSDKALIESLLTEMHENSADFTLTFFHLSRVGGKSPEQDGDCRTLFTAPVAFDQWAVQWRERLEKETRSDKERQAAMQAVNPVYIPRNHQVEAVIRAAEDGNDFSLFHKLHEVLQDPFVLQPGKENYQRPPEPEEVVKRTFCGT
ncbi:MAG: YdiU family protein [Gammaproteobacteria bacterium]|nr:YdiU family protein [Gammaproteobacteria bacterium]MDH5799529.1 YdiU family protein [Gammaproteobacteria bacterium]